MKIDLSKKITEYAKKILVIILIIHICILSIGSSGVRADTTVDVKNEIDKFAATPPDKDEMNAYIEVLKEYAQSFANPKPNLEQALNGNFNTNPSTGYIEKMLVCLVDLYGKTGASDLNPYTSSDFNKWRDIATAMAVAIDNNSTSATIDGTEYKIDPDLIDDWDSILHNIEEAKERTFEEEPIGSGEDLDETDNILLDFLDGIAGVLFIGFKIVPIIVGGALSLIMNVSSGEDITIYNILFNEVGLTNINFFQNATGSNAGTVNQIRENVAIWYVSLRNLAAIVLALILIYVAIRMAISTVAEEKAKYKRMIIDWATSLCLLFVLHYIMVIVININNSFVELLAKAATTGPDLNNIGRTLVSEAFTTISFTKGVGYAVAYMMLVGMSFIYFFAYIKRMITLAFLIIISPLITITYSIDKMGDGKSQALNTWLKEFVYNILMQPFQCVIYLSLVSTVLGMLDEGTPGLLTVSLAVYVLMFMYQAEEIVKNIFGFKSQSMGKTIAMAAITGAVISKGTALLKGGKDEKKKNTSGSDYKQRPRTKNAPDTAQEGAGAVPPGTAPSGGQSRQKSIEEMYAEEGFGKNNNGEYFNPWTDEYDRNYDPNNDKTYQEMFNRQTNRGNTPAPTTTSANSGASAEPIDIMNENQVRGVGGGINMNYTTKGDKVKRTIANGAKTVGKGLLKANVNTGLRIAGLALGLSTGELNTGIAGWGLGSAGVNRINDAIEKHELKTDEDSRFSSVANSIDDFQGDNMTNTQVMQRTQDWLDGVSMPDRDDDAGLKLYQQLMEEQEIQRDLGKSQEEAREIVDKLIRDSLSGAQSRVPKASLAERVKNKFANQSGNIDTTTTSRGRQS